MFLPSSEGARSRPITPSFTRALLSKGPLIGHAAIQWIVIEGQVVRRTPAPRAGRRPGPGGARRAGGVRRKKQYDQRRGDQAQDGARNLADRPREPRPGGGGVARRWGRQRDGDSCVAGFAPPRRRSAAPAGRARAPVDPTPELTLP